MVTTPQQASTRRLSMLRDRLVLLAVAVQVYGLLIVTRLVIWVLPMRSITAKLGRPMEETERAELGDAERRYVWRVGAMIRRLAPFTPTTSNCYPQALTAWWLLARRGIPMTYYYGARFADGGQGLDAHVWLRAGNITVTGGLSGEFRALATYAADPQWLRQVTRRRYLRAPGAGS